MKRPIEFARLYRMLEAAQKAANLIQGRKRLDLESDETLVLALTRLLEIIGEAANGTSQALQAENPQIPWRPMIAARNDFIHADFDVDRDMIWEILQSDVPPLISDLTKLIEQEG
jgi:uncharacterized protein with HEPN domain